MDKLNPRSDKERMNHTVSNWIAASKGSVMPQFAALKLCITPLLAVRFFRIGFQRTEKGFLARWQPPMRKPALGRPLTVWVILGNPAVHPPPRR
jgi:hypothetical protein